jgi:hypothetical protein
MKKCIDTILSFLFWTGLMLVGLKVGLPMVVAFIAEVYQMITSYISDAPMSEKATLGFLSFFD